jgi:hypothetical protein
MLGLMILSVLAALIAGLSVKLALDRLRRPMQITWKELWIGMAIVSVAVAPLACWAGWSMARANVLSFEEYRNGWELEAVEEIVPCEVNGRCRYVYECHCRDVCRSRDADGDCTHWDEECDECPYFNFERNVYIRTTLGDFPIAWLAPEAYLVERKTSGMPPGFGPDDYTVPQFWLDCQARVESGRPGPVTKRTRYDNYILASDRTILKQHSGMIDHYWEARLLPPIQFATYDHYHADKVSFVGQRAEDERAWQTALSYLNAALGCELRGDLHLVILRDPDGVVDPDAYALALKAHWQNPDVWGDDCLGHNGIVVVLGTADGETVAWARAQTGMPLGNEHLMVAIRNELPGAPLTPESVIGPVRGAFYTRESDGELTVRGTGESGALRRILWGLDDPQTRFVRVSMTANDPDDVGGGFLYLDSEIQPKAGQKLAIVMVTFLLTSMVWVVAAFAGEKRRRRRRR